MFVSCPWALLVFFVCVAGKMAQKEPKMKYKYIYAIDIHPPIVKHILQMYYEIYIHPPYAQRAPRQPPTDIYPLNVGSIYPIQNVHSPTPIPNYTYCTLFMGTAFFIFVCLCICIFVFVFVPPRSRDTNVALQEVMAECPSLTTLFLPLPMVCG